MKKLMMVAIVLSLGLSLGWAKDKKNEDVKTTVFVTDIHCESCSTKIMTNVPVLGKGVKDVVVNVADKTVAVTYDANKNNDEKIIKGLKSLNVEAQPITKPTCVMPPITQEQAARMNGKAEAQECCKEKAEAQSCCKEKAKAEAQSCCKEKAKAEAQSCCKEK